MAGSPVGDAPHHRVKPEPGAEANGSCIASSVPLANTTGAKLVENNIGSNSSCRNSYIEQLISSSSVSELEAAVQVGIRLLKDLKAPLNATQGSGDSHVAHWLQKIRQVEEKAKPARTVVGVVGVTGAGKSSVINAVLDEEKLVPTSGLRACTASATEISYNHSDDPQELYRAEVEFISAEEWSQELKTLVGGLIDGNDKISSDCYNPDTDAGHAFSKLKAVYPKKTKEKILRHASDPSVMAQEPDVHAVLGSVKRLRATSSPDLFENLQQYIDSKEKKSSEMEYWPLIKAVRIYCKAAALSTGVVIVDLPGVQDSNAARAAVAENYIKMCNGLWITADIQRATNAKAAKQLLGDSFKRQLKYDGALSAVTFICTKADDILTSEVQNSLNIEDQLGEYWDQIEVLGVRRDKLTFQIDTLKEQKSDLGKQLEALDQSSEQWEELQEQLAGGNSVYRPSDISKKRKREISPSDNVDTVLDDTISEEIGQLSQVSETPLTEENVEDELATIKTKKKDARMAKKKLDEQISKIEHELAEVTAEEAGMQSETRSLSIRGRNKYVKESIKRDFVLGIKELDQDLAIEEDEGNFDPDEEIRDYDELARNLPVFCVSARAFQKLAGRLERDTVQTDGFASLDDTEIPQLQEHAKRITEGNRTSISRLFLNELNQLVNSMKLWAVDGMRPAVIQKALKVDEEVLHDSFTKLDNSFREAVEDCHSSLKHDLGNHLYKAFDALIPIASGSAVDTAIGWGKPRPEGLFWGTYKATCRHDGSWHGAYGEKDFNAELFEPINRQLAGSWERVFQRRIPRILRVFAEECKSLLQAFHSDVVTNVLGTTASTSRLDVLNQQKRAYQTMLEATPNLVGVKITESQREANRGFTPVIQVAMQPAYDSCTRERGIGTFVRMKSTMESHVVTVRNTMFRQACDTVKGQLDSMCDGVEEGLMAFVQDLLAKLQRDYITTLAGGSAEASAEVPYAEQVLRGQVRPILEVADSRFAEFCFPATGRMSTTAVGSEQEEDLIAQQLEDIISQQKDGVSDSGTETGVKPEPM